MAAPLYPDVRSRIQGGTAAPSAGTRRFVHVLARFE